MERFWRLLAQLGLLGKREIYYIGGSDVLPAPLKGQDEQDALTRLEAGDESAKQLLIEHNLRLVVYIARRFENTGVNLEDLISIGTIGLIKAISTYRRDKNIKLATYASTMGIGSATYMGSGISISNTDLIEAGFILGLALVK